ncbi:MAG: MurR/RpiR family transcriptional regulator [Ruminococcaceae bacterium]|nr:MurR/RpiR family transcriptional regulator [Oscillospiraceae bacterium]
MIAEIHNKYAKLTEIERKVADYVLKKPQEIPRMTAKSLADAAGCVPSAVIRFCKTMGCEGFSEFKISLAGELGARENATLLPAFAREDDPETVFRKVFQSGVQTLQDTLKMLDFETIEAITRLFSEAERIFIFGVGTSSVIAVDAQYRLSQLGLSAVSCTDVLFMNVTAVNARQGDVVLAISHSGMTRAVVDAIRHAKACGAATVAITSFSDSLLARECDHAVTVFADEKNYPVEAVSARVAHICLVDAFMMALATMHYDGLATHIEGRNRVLGEIRYGKNEEVNE